MIPLLKKSPLFAHMSDGDIERCLLCSRSEAKTYEKDEPIFFQHEAPRKLFILLEGSVAVCSDSFSGKRSIIATFSQPGELFGEVFLFLEKGEYDNYAQAVVPSKVLLMPKEFLYHTCGVNCGYHTVLISNMLSILAGKAYYLNQKLQVLSGSSLRQKIARILLQNASGDGTVAFAMNREELADFLNVARPSLSRELMKMQEEGLLQIDKRQIKIVNIGTLQSCL